VSGTICNLSVESVNGPMWTLYILQSESSGRFYVGHTNDLERRLEEHQSGQTTSTRNRGPWKVVHCERFETKLPAAYRECQIKSWKSRVGIQALIEESEPDDR